MAIIDISVVPVGTGKPSVSDYVAGAVRILKNEPGLKYELTAMNTIIEGDLDKLLSLAQRMHNSAFDAGAKRVVTTLRIDERRDKPLTMEGKIKAVKNKLGK
ncbi:MAG: MTH1187 family thiamine-binding protein [Dehalococcoidales bacterium]|nr:MTH1187 family thiamine-binding protein [Dehalococcoidales bacterium]